MRVKTIEHIAEKLGVEIRTAFYWLRIRSFGALSIFQCAFQCQKIVEFLDQLGSHYLLMEARDSVSMFSSSSEK
jgi:hypothetical protein